MPSETTTSYIPLLVTAVAGISSLIALIVQAALSRWQTSRLQQHETTRQLRDLAVKLAIEKWQYEAPLRDKLRNDIQTNRNPGDRLPQIPGISLNDTVLEMVALLQTIPNKTQNTKQK